MGTGGVPAISVDRLTRLQDAAQLETRPSARFDAGSSSPTIEARVRMNPSRGIMAEHVQLYGYRYDRRLPARSQVSGLKPSGTKSAP